MKGSILEAIGELVEKKLGKRAWEEILEEAGVGRFQRFLPTKSYPDEVFYQILEGIKKKTRLSLEEIADLFGEYWMIEYAPKVYKIFFHEVKDIKSFLKKLDWVHEVMTRTTREGSPPRFEVWEEGEDLYIRYKSQRNLKEIFLGLLRGVGKYYQVEMSIHEVEPNLFRVYFY